MKCPHCLVNAHMIPEVVELGQDSTSKWTLFRKKCPSCGKFILSLFEQYERQKSSRSTSYLKKREFLCYPKAPNRVPLSEHIPDDFAKVYNEACLTLVDSPMASAALSRRCFQHLLREVAGVKKGSLADEIQQVIKESKLPTHLLESIDAIRNIGNFAAHPIKSNASGEIIDVEPGEAEWNLDVLESLFDYYFVQPAVLKKKKAALNEKLKIAGKSKMK